MNTSNNLAGLYVHALPLGLPTKLATISFDCAANVVAGGFTPYLQNSPSWQPLFPAVPGTVNPVTSTSGLVAGGFDGLAYATPLADPGTEISFCTAVQPVTVLYVATRSTTAPTFHLASYPES